jgi:hypothetical protein
MSTQLEAAPRFIPIQLSFWERCYGPTFLDYELSKMMEFARAKKAERVKISGYVKRVRDDCFLLLPTLYTPQIYLPCFLAEGEPLPPENAYVNIEGVSQWTNLRNDGSTQFQGEQAINVQTWCKTSLESVLEKPRMDFNQFKSELFAPTYNVEPIIQDLLAYQIVSCPSFEQFLGGLNISLYDATNHKAARDVAKVVGMIVPRDLGKPHTISSSFGETQLRYKFNLINIDADRSFALSLAEAMTNRRTSGALSELSISISSGKSRPKTLEDLPCSLTDFPTILNENADLTTARIDPNLDAFKYMLHQHLVAPEVENSVAITDTIQERLMQLPNHYDMSSDTLARCKMLDASYTGRPQSILRLALAACRANNLSSVTRDYATKIYEEYFLKNFENVYQTWSETDLFRKKGISLPDLSGDEQKIVRVVEAHESTDKKHATFREIADETKLDDFILSKLLFDLTQRKSFLYEAHQGCYRTIRRG